MISEYEIFHFKKINFFPGAELILAPSCWAPSWYWRRVVGRRVDTGAELSAPRCRRRVVRRRDDPNPWRVVLIGRVIFEKFSINFYENQKECDKWIFKFRRRLYKDACFFKFLVWSYSADFRMIFFRFLSCNLKYFWRKLAPNKWKVYIQKLFGLEKHRYKS